MCWLNRFLILAGAFSLFVFSLSALALSQAPPSFERTWNRTDFSVRQHVINRTWIWGPSNWNRILNEPYQEAPGGIRRVEYFDKARMEMSHTVDDDTALWQVTNGLLVVELITGRMQVGDTSFIDRWPAQVNVAGDPDDPQAPTYATLTPLLHSLPSATGSLIVETLDRDGRVDTDSRMAEQDVTAAHFVPETNHNVASVFWEFMNSEGLIYQDGQYAVERLFLNPFYATGYPITEAYWSRIRVAGVDKDVLIQCFERCCLTYTPSNPDGWQVEAANVGQHYFHWRYDQPMLTGRVAFTSYHGTKADVVVLDLASGERRRLTDDLALDAEPVWSPDGTQIVFRSERAGSSDLYVMDADGANVRWLTSGLHASRPAWSPDGRTIVFSALTEESSDLFLIDQDGGNLRQIPHAGRDGTPSWSPDGQRIAWSCEAGIQSKICVMDADGHNPMQLTFDDASDSGPQWSPDGQLIVFQRYFPVLGLADADIVVMNADGSQQRNLTNNPHNGEYKPAWSPDGAQIIFVSNNAENMLDLYVINADGTYVGQVMTDQDQDHDPAWSFGSP